LILPLLLRFTPLWASLIYFLKLNGEKWFWLSELSFFSSVVFLSLYPIQLPNVSNSLNLYLIFTMTYLAILSHRFGFSYLNKSLAASLWLMFIASEYWEAPTFFSKIPQAFHSGRISVHLFDGLYVFTLLFCVFLILSKTVGFKLSKTVVAVLAVNFAVGVLLFLLRIGSLARVVTLVLFCWFPMFNLKIDGD
jgi:hypothetical protein